MSFAILAPSRRVLVTGSNNGYENPTFVGPIWARSVAMSGFTYLYPGDDGDVFCGP